MADDPLGLSPQETTTFEQMGCAGPVLLALSEMGFEHPAPVQVRTFGAMLAGRDLMVQSQTGSGKTAAFGIPMAQKLVTPRPGVQAMVLVPTRELALQVADELARITVHTGQTVVAIYGGAAMGRQVEALRAGAQIVVGTPGRVLDHLRRGTLKTAELRLLVLDEADEMLSMGFEQDIQAIVAQLPSSRQTVLFSATIPADIQRLAQRHMRDPEFVSLSSDQVAALEIRHFMYRVSGAGRAQDLCRILEFENPESALLFCNTREETQLIARALVKAGWNAAWISSDLGQADREKVMQRLREGKVRFLVATDVAARGIDISRLSHVINVSFPESLELYVHRTGRTGRMGRAGTAISLVTPRDLGNLYFLRLLYRIQPIERELPSEAEERTRREMDQLESLLVDLSDEPGEDYRALARRVLVHLEGERVLAALLRRHFEAALGRVAERAASRRAAPPAAPLVQATEPSPEEPAARTAPAPLRTAAPGTTPADAKTLALGISTAVLPRERTEAESGPTAPERSGLGTRGAAPAAPPSGSPEDFWERYKPLPPPIEAPAAPEAVVAVPPEPSNDDASGSESLADEAPEAGMTTLFMNIGRRDGVRAAELVKLVRERAGLGAADVGQVRVRNRHTFIGIRTELVEAVIAAVSGMPYGERSLVVEAARAMRGSE